jgi:hypothetical protein
MMSATMESKPVLQLEERDALKYTLALVAAGKLVNTFDIPVQSRNLESFSRSLRHLANLQPFSDRVPPFGLVYIGRPDFMTDDLVQALREEAALYRSRARPIAAGDPLQFLYQSDTHAGELLSEQLAESKQVKDLVETHTGAVDRSYVTSYIYYDQPGHCSKPHIDNYFTSVTAMVGLRHDSISGVLSSSSVIYWPDRPRLNYQLRPGEVAIFFGVSVLHGRTPVVAGETVHSLLLSFRPK